MAQSVLESILAWCRHYGAPDPGEPDAEMRFRARPEFAAWVEGRAIDGWPAPGAAGTWFNRDPLPVYCSHEWPGAASKQSYRECAAYWSCQVVMFAALVGTVVAYQIDFDEENPLGGALPALQHLGRVIKRWLWGGETKAEAVARGLGKRGIHA